MTKPQPSPGGPIVLQASGGATHPGWNRDAVSSAFRIIMIEGIEVVFIVVAVGATGRGLLIPAGLGPGAASLLVIILGFVLHKPASMIPENNLKFVVGLLLCAYGSFWVGEGMGLAWPGGAWSIPALSLGFLVTILLALRLC